MPEKDKYKKDKFEERVMNELNSFLRSRFTDTRLRHVSITRVEVTPDHSRATAYWDTYDAGTRGDAKKAMESIRGKIRTLLAGALKTRTVPEISFAYDPQYEAERKITDLLKKEVDEGRGPGEASVPVATKKKPSDA